MERAEILAAVKEFAKKQVNEEERKLFLGCVGGYQTNGRGRPISSPGANGFVWLDDILEHLPEEVNDQLTDMVKVTKKYRTRESMFEDVIELVHKLSYNFKVYLGRTYLRKGSEWKGPRNRFINHLRKRRMEWGKTLAIVPRESIIRDEEMAISLVECWSRIKLLCCNNNVMLSSGNISRDPLQLIYICAKAK